MAPLSSNLLFLFPLVLCLELSDPALALDFQLGRWMGDVFSGSYSDTVLLKDILLPGSHNAGAYRIMDTNDNNGNIPPTCGQVDLTDVPDWVLEQLIDWERGQEYGVNLVETQRFDILGQLELGIRYLDLRLGWLEANQEIRLHHTLFMDVTLEQVLNQVFLFLSSSPSEVVILKMRLQCGSTFAQVQQLLEASLGNIYGGPLLNSTMLSPLSQVRGKAYVLFDESDQETANAIATDSTNQRSISYESFYRTNPCGGNNDNDDSCWAWPEYRKDQGRWLHDKIVEDIATTGSQLSNWNTGPTVPDTFRVLSFIGVLPLGSQDCTPSSSARLFTAILSCPRISIYSYTETFQRRFLDLLATLQGTQMDNSVNSIQLDYVDTFPIDAIVRLNEEVALQLDASVTTSTSQGNAPSIFSEAAVLAEMPSCWDDLLNDGSEELASPHIKLYDEFNCHGRQLTKYENDANLEDDVIQRFLFWVREHWNDRVHSLTLTRCARTNLPSSDEQECLAGSYTNLRLVLYPDTNYRGSPLSLTCPYPEEDVNGNGSMSGEYTIEIGSFVKTQMACSFNLPEAWVGRVSSFQIQQSEVSNRRERLLFRRDIHESSSSESKHEWRTIGGIPETNPEGGKVIQD